MSSFPGNQPDGNYFCEPEQPSDGIPQPEEMTNEEYGYYPEPDWHQQQEQMYYSEMRTNQYSSLTQALSFAKHGEQEPETKKRAKSATSDDDVVIIKEEKKKRKHRKRGKSDSESDGDRKHKKRKKEKEKKRKHRDRESRRERRSSEQENKPSTSGFLCNSEKWSFYKPNIHIDSRDFFLTWTKSDYDNFRYDKFISTERTKYELTCKDDILGADDEILRIFDVKIKKRSITGFTDSKKTKSKRSKVNVRYGPLPPRDPEPMDSFVTLGSASSKGMVEETDPLEKELQELRVRRREEPQNKALFREIMELEDKLAAKRALYCSSKESVDVMHAHKERMLLLWKEYAVNFSKDVGAVTGYLALLVDKETMNSGELKTEIVNFINSRKPFFIRNVEFWRLILTKVYRKLSKSVLDYIKYIDGVLNDFAYNGHHENEEFVAELILLRTRLLFESGHIPSVVATVQLLIEVAYFIPADFGKQPLKQVRSLVSQFWESGYPRSCEVYPQQIKDIFPKSECGFTHFLEVFKATRGNVLDQASSTAAAHFLSGLKEMVFRSTESLFLRMPADISEADLWSELEEIRAQHLWFPLTSYAGVELSALMSTAEVPFSRIESTVYFFKDQTITRQLLLDIFALFGVSSPTASTNEDNVFGQLGIFDFPNVSSGLVKCNEWLESTLELLAKTTDKESEIFAYTLIATKSSQMNDLGRFQGFIKSQSGSTSTDVLTCAVIDQAFNNFDFDLANSHSRSLGAYAVLESLLRVIYDQVESFKPVCINERGAAGSIYTLRVYSRLLTTCPDVDDQFKPQGMTRNHLFATIIGDSNVKAIKASLKGAFGFSAISDFLRKALDKAMKRPLSGHALGEAATYVGFFLAVSEFVRKKRSVDVFTGCVEQLTRDYPKFFQNAIFAELVMQFLWKREGVVEDLRMREAVWRLNTEFLERHSTSAPLMKLMASNGFYEGKSFALRRLFTLSHKDPFVNVVRGCASIYFSAIRANRLGSSLLDMVLEREFTRSALRKIVTNSALCSDSSAFARTWLRFEKQVSSISKAISINDFTRDVLALPFSKFILTDYVKVDPSYYSDAIKLIFNERAMLGYTLNIEARALRAKCIGTEPHHWNWPSPLCRRLKLKIRGDVDCKEVV